MEKSLVEWLREKREEYAEKFSQPETVRTVFNYLIEDARKERPGLEGEAL